jgi:hypothetical protein
VCPASVVPVWREEIARHFPDLVDVLKTGHDFTQPAGTGDLAGELHAAAQAPGAARRGVEFGYAVLDEGQFIKNPDAKVTQTCFACGPGTGSY